MLVTMATPISSHVKEKNSIFTAHDFLEKGEILVFHQYLYNKFGYLKYFKRKAVKCQGKWLACQRAFSLRKREPRTRLQLRSWSRDSLLPAVGPPTTFLIFLNVSCSVKPLNYLLLAYLISNNNKKGVESLMLGSSFHLVDNAR